MFQYPSGLYFGYCYNFIIFLLLRIVFASCELVTFILSKGLLLILWGIARLVMQIVLHL